jgi:hypothetical protein
MRSLRLHSAFVLALLGGMAGYGQSGSVQEAKLSQNDRAAILKLVFEDAVEPLVSDKGLSTCTIPIVDDKKVLLIQTDTPKIFPVALGEYRFLAKNRDGIEAEIKSNNGDCFLRTGLFLKKDQVVTINLARWMSVVWFDNAGRSSYPSRWIYAVGRTYEARKRAGKWVVKFIDRTAIVS